MKKVLLAMATALAATTASAVHTSSSDVAIDVAFELVLALEEVADEADYLASQAARRGQQQQARNLSNLAQTAESTADKVYQRIVIALEDGATLQYAKAQLSRLNSSFQLLARDADAVQYMSYNLMAALDEVDDLKALLALVLSGSDRDRPGRPVRPTR